MCQLRGIIILCFLSLICLASDEFSYLKKWENELNDYPFLFENLPYQKIIEQAQSVLDSKNIKSTKEKLLQLDLFFSIGKEVEYDSLFMILDTVEMSNEELFVLAFLQGSRFNFQGDYYRSDSVYQNIESRFLEHVSTVDKGRFWFSRGVNYEFWYKINEGIRSIHKSFEYLKSEPNELGWAYLEMGLLLLDVNRPNEAMTFFKLGEDLFRSIKNHRSLSYALGYKGVAYGEMGKLEIALSTYNEAIPYREREGSDEGVGELLNNRATVLMDLNKFDLAGNSLEKSWAIFTKIGDDRQLPPILRNLAEVRLKQGRFSEFIQLVDSSINLSKKFDTRYSESDCYKLLSAYYDSNGQYQKAVFYLNKFNEIEVEKKEIAKLDEDILWMINLDSETLKDEVVVLKEKEVSQSKLIWIMVLIITIGVFGGGFYWKKRIKKVVEKEREIEKKGEKISQIELANESIDLRHKKIKTENDAIEFKRMFQRSFPEVSLRIERKYKQLTDSDYRMIIYALLEMKNKEVANNLAISEAAVRVAKHRLLKKVELKTTEELKKELDF